MRQRSKLHFALATALGTGVLAAAQPAVAQSNEAEAADAISDNVIIVTARGRDENILDVPISETVFDEEAIQDADIQRVDDFIDLTPGVTIANSQDSGTNFITIRGVSQVRNGEPPVAVVIDGVLQVDARSFDQPLFDVESIEVLRGPQGALYGRNATQGAIIINTRGPTDVFEGYVQAGYGRGDDFSIEGSIAGPIVEDAVRFRLSAKYRDRDGILRNNFLDEEVDYTEEFAVRGHLQFDVSDRVTADLRASYVNNTNGSLNFTFQGAFVDPATGLPGGIDFAFADANQVDREFFANNLGRDERDLFQASLRVNVDLDFADLLFTSSYDSIEQISVGDQFPYTQATTLNPSATFFAIGDGGQSQFTDISAFSQEIRLTSKDDGPIRWAIGAYYLQTDRFISSTVTSDLEQGLFQYRRTPDLVASNPLQSFFGDDNDNEAWALFANVAYDITDTLELALSGRFDDDSREQNVSAANGVYTDGVLTTPSVGAGLTNNASFSEFQPKISLRWNVADYASLYASWGTGFRSGQFNQNGTAAAAAGVGLVGVDDLLDEETTESFELGGKASLADGAVNVAASVFHTDVENAPFFVFVGAIGAQVLVPIDEVEIYGGEFELSANVEDGVDLFFGASVNDAEITEYALNPANIGNEAPYVPTHTINVGGQVFRPISDTLGIFARADFENRGRQFWDADNTTSRSAINLVNARFGIKDLNGRWSLIGSLTNAFDEVYNSEFVQGGFAHAAEPRVWKVDFRYNF